MHQAASHLMQAGVASVSGSPAPTGRAMPFPRPAASAEPGARALMFALPVGGADGAGDAASAGAGAGTTASPAGDGRQPGMSASSHSGCTVHTCARVARSSDSAA